MQECVFIDGVRTPNGRAHREKGWFRNLRPDELLTEAQVFAKYGLVDKAISHLQRLLAQYPEHEPARLLLAGLEPGVWADYPSCQRLLSSITPLTYTDILPALSGSAATDVTGGMASKVVQAVALAQQIPGLEVLIFSGLSPGAVQQVLTGQNLGTRIFNPSS